MEKKYLEIYIDKTLIGGFENVKNFEESENHLSFTSDEGDFEINKNSQGIWRTRVFGVPVSFTDYRLVGRRTILKKVDADVLGHGKEQKQYYDELQGEEANE